MTSTAAITHKMLENTSAHRSRAGGTYANLSDVVGKDYHTEEHVIGYDNAGDRMGRVPSNAVQGKIGSVPR